METDYWHSLDRESQMRSINPRSLGVSTSINKKGLDQLKARIFEGASNVELGFMGKEKGSLGQGGTTPGMHSKQEREEIRQMAKVNEVSLSTHATIALGGVAGLGERGFDPAQKEKAVHEIQRTVDFAAETAGGGPIVVHTGEFPRPIMAAEKEFEAHPKEEERRMHYLVDEHTGDIIKTVREDETIWVHEPMKDKQGKIVYQKEPDGRDKVIKDTNIKVPEYALDKDGNIITNPLSFKNFKKDFVDNYSNWGYKNKEAAIRDAPKKFFEKQQMAEVEHAAGQAEQYELSYKEGLKRKQELEKLHDAYKKSGTDEGKQLALQQATQMVRSMPGENKEEFFNDAIREAEKTMTYGREIAISSRKNAAKLGLSIERAQPLENYAVDQSADALARSAIYAYDKEKTMKLDKPLFIAPENIFPEQFGAHPQELKKLVLESRKKMESELVASRDMNKSEAKKVATDHIKATFDVGHANTWKKYFKREKGETLEQSDKRFKKWMTDQVKDLQKAGVIGHVHVSDNFGYYDEHLAPGEGNVPLKELADKLEKHGYKGKYITEWGAQPEAQSFRVMTGAWNTLASPVYKIDTTGMAWSDIEGSYFGKTGSPNYLVGDYAPSKDWTLWSETQLE